MKGYPLRWRWEWHISITSMAWLQGMKYPHNAFTTPSGVLSPNILLKEMYIEHTTAGRIRWFPSTRKQKKKKCDRGHGMQHWNPSQILARYNKLFNLWVSSLKWGRDHLHLSELRGRFHVLTFLEHLIQSHTLLTSLFYHVQDQG